MMTMIRPTTRYLRDPIIWTHALFMINVYLYGDKGYYIIGAMMFINALFSLFYHLSHEEDDTWEDLDRIFCRLTLGCIAWYLIKSCTMLQVILSIFWLLISLVILEMGNIKDYQIFHSLWHFMVFGGNLIVWSYLPALW